MNAADFKKIEELFPNIKKGDLILIKKGTPISSTNGKQNVPAGRSYFVKFDHSLGGMRLPIHVAVQDRHFHERLVAAGHDIEALKALRDTDPKRFYDEMIYVTAPTVRWAGTGGYWHEAPAHAITQVVHQI